VRALQYGAAGSNLMYPLLLSRYYAQVQLQAAYIVVRRVLCQFIRIKCCHFIMKMAVLGGTVAAQANLAG
jgi:hypothetical protein